MSTAIHLTGLATIRTSGLKQSGESESLRGVEGSISEGYGTGTFSFSSLMLIHWNPCRDCRVQPQRVNELRFRAVMATT